MRVKQAAGLAFLQSHANERAFLRIGNMDHLIGDIDAQIVESASLVLHA
jgi:hypothetical protein